MRCVTKEHSDMRVLVDTNILFSALLFPNSKPARALLHVSDDKDFLSLDMEHPRCMTASQFLEMEGI